MSEDSDTDTDITRLILDDHDTFRRGFADLDDIQGSGADTSSRAAELSAVWDPLAALLDVHAAAEERVFYPELLGRGADADDETVDAVGDHNDIRDAVAATRGHPVGSDAWWESVGVARAANTEHMGEEEDEALADFRRHATPGLRADLGRRFLEFKDTYPRAADLPTEDAEDKDPQVYVAAHRGDGDDGADGSLGIGSLQ